MITAAPVWSYFASVFTQSRCVDGSGRRRSGIRGSTDSYTCVLCRLCGMAVREEGSSIVGFSTSGRVLKATIDPQNLKAAYEGWLDNLQ